MRSMAAPRKYPDELREWPRALTALRMRALTDSIAFVVHTTRRISRSNCKNGTTRALKPVYQAATVAEAEERFLEFQEKWGRKYPAIAGLRDRGRPHGGHGIRQALETVADEHEHILDPTVTVRSPTGQSTSPWP
jgi:hypothetical protein